MNAIQIINLAAKQPAPASGKEGICRITGMKTRGVPFSSWVKDTFTDYGSLYPGDIIGHEALFCFDEASELIMRKTGRDKPQRFRTYSHIVCDGEWHCLTKADKEKIVGLIKSGKCEVVCLTDSGQKHIFFKNRPGFWQLDDMHVAEDLPDFERLHGLMMQMLALGFGQEQVKSGKYSQAQILKAGIDAWQEIESKLAVRRGEPMFDFAAWLMFTVK
jgi:hypothetical protein